MCSLVMKNKQCLSLYMLVIFHASLSSVHYFQDQLFQKILSEILSECQTVWIQIRPDVQGIIKMFETK